jgi:hypothetical protein
LEPYLLQDIMGFVILTYVAVDKAKERVLISADQRFKSFLITSKGLLKQDVV